MYLRNEFYMKFLNVIYKTVLYVGGNQREKSREKAMKKQKEAEKKKGSNEKGANKGLTLEERRHR